MFGHGDSTWQDNGCGGSVVYWLADSQLDGWEFDSRPPRKSIIPICLCRLQWTIMRRFVYLLWCPKGQFVYRTKEDGRVNTDCSGENILCGTLLLSNFQVYRHIKVTSHNRAWRDFGLWRQPE